MTNGILSTTRGGQVSRSEVYLKLLDHVREAQDCAALMSHLHNTEDSPKDKIMALGWLTMSELFKRCADQVTMMAQGKMQ